MGYIDQTTHTARCPKCGAAESVTIRESGSAYGSSWGAGKPMEKFEVVWDDGKNFGPSIISAKCNDCDTASEITIS